MFAKQGDSSEASTLRDNKLIVCHSEAEETDEERCRHTKMLWLGCIHLCHQLVTR